VLAFITDRGGSEHDFCFLPALTIGRKDDIFEVLVCAPPRFRRLSE
jgi:hypothetical protein